MKDHRKEKMWLLSHNVQLHARRNRVITLFVLKLLLLEGALIALTAYLLSFGIISAIPLGLCLGILLPILILKPKKTFGSRLFGRITKIEPSVRWTSKYKNAGFLNNMYQKRVIVCTVMKQDGSERQIELDSQYWAVFAVGDEILEIEGINYPINLTPRDKILCPFCGSIMPIANQYCVGCGARPIETKKKPVRKDTVSF